MDYYLYNPLELIIYNPITKKFTQKERISGGTKDEDIFDIFDEDIETIKKEQKKLYSNEDNKGYQPASIKHQSTNALDRINFYPSDSFVDVRNKITILTGIPLFRQHIIYSNNYYNSTTNPLYIYKQLYDIYKGAEYVIYNIINDFSGNNSNVVKGVPVDRTIYNSRSDLTVVAKDMTILLESRIKSVVVIDLFSILLPDPEFRTISQYELDLLYYGMVFKFFPMIEFDTYNNIYKNNVELASKNKEIKNIYYKANRILLNTIKNKQLVIKEYKKVTTRSIYYITKAIVNFDIPTLDNRLFIDKFKLDDFFIFIGTTVQVGIRKFLVTKRYGIFDKNKIKLKNLPKGAIFIQTSSMVKILLQQNRCSMELNFNSNDITYSKVYAKVNNIYKFISKFITSKKNIVTRGDSINNIGELYISSSDVHLFWPRAVMSGDFGKLINIIKEYVEAQLIRLISIESGFYIISLVYGVKVNVPYLLDNIPIDNGYKYYTDSVYKEQYDAYRIKDITITQKSSELDILFKSVSENEFNNDYEFILNMLYNFMKTIGRTSYIEIETKKKLKRLKTIDPELFDIKRHDEKKSVYAVKCQLARQPVIYRSNEMKNINNKNKTKAVKFWNFTEKKHVYYICPTSKYPHLSFRPQEHPLGYCLPCCKKKIPSDNSVQKAIDTACLKNYSIEATKLRDIIKQRKIETHFLSYGKMLDIGRTGFPPEMFIDKPRYKLYGVEQIIPAFENGGLIYSIVYSLKITLEKFVKDILEQINPTTFNMLNLGGIKKLMTPNSLKDLLVTIILDTSSSVLVSVDTNHINWIDIITELVYFTYAINVITIIDIGTEYRMKLIRTTEVAILTEEKMNEYIMVIQNKEGTYPLIDTEKENKNNAIYEINDYPIQYAKKALLSKTRCDENMCNLTITTIIFFVSRHKNYSIKYLLRGKRSYVYAIILENSSIKHTGADSCNNCIYVPIVYTEFLSDEYEIIDIFIPRYQKFPRTNLYKFIEEFNKDNNNLYKIEFTYLLQHKNNFVGVAASIGDVTGYSYIFPHKDVSVESKDTILLSYDNTPLPIVDVPYDIATVNKAIERYSGTESPIVKRALIYLYNINIYNLFVIEFSTILRKNRNTKIRNTLGKEFNSNKINISRIRDILSNYKQDIPSIIEIINNNLPYNVIKIISETIFDFDLGEMIKLKNTTDIKERKQLIISMVGENIKIVDNRPKDISNNFISCNYDQKQPQCANQKLMMTADDYSVCVTKLANSIDNPYMYETLLSNVIGQINPLLFTKYKFEILKIREI